MQRKILKRGILKQYMGTISVSQCQRWFQKFRAGNYSLEDELRPERSVEIDEDVLQTLMELKSHRNY